MIVHSGHDLAFAAIGQHQPADQIHLPQLHRCVALPPFVIFPTTTPRHRFNQTMANQYSMDHRPRRYRPRASRLTQLVQQPPGTPPPMTSPQLANRRLNLGPNLRR
jgi:hypothetical protein